MMVRMSLCASCSSSTISLATLYELSVSVLNGNSTVRVCPEASPIFSRRRSVLSSRMRPLTRKSSDPPFRRGSGSEGGPAAVGSAAGGGSTIDARLSLLTEREDRPSRLFGRGKPPAAFSSPVSRESSSRLPEGDGFSDPRPASLASPPPRVEPSPSPGPDDGLSARRSRSPRSFRAAADDAPFVGDVVSDSALEPASLPPCVDPSCVEPGAAANAAAGAEASPLSLPCRDPSSRALACASASGLNSPSAADSRVERAPGLPPSSSRSFLSPATTAYFAVPPGRSASGSSSTFARTTFSTTFGLRLLSRKGSFMSSFAVSRFSMGEMHFKMNDRRSLSMILSSASGLTPCVTRL